MGGSPLTCIECGAFVLAGGSKKHRLCNRHYIQMRRGGPKTCLLCGREAKVRRTRQPICADCEVKEFAARYVVAQRDRFSRIPVDPVETSLKGYFNHLVKWYGDRPKPIWEAFYPIDDLFRLGELSTLMTWDSLESYRKGYSGIKSVRYKAALYAYMEYLSGIGVIEPREEKQFDQMFDRHVNTVLPRYRSALRDYITFCLEERQLSRVTVLNESVQVRDFLVWLGDTTGGQHIGVVHRGLVREYLAAELEGYSQKSIYLIHKAIRDFFKWAKLRRLVFSNPAYGVTVKAPLSRPEPLPIATQRRLFHRWTGMIPSPIEAAVGLLALIYGLSLEEIASLRLADIDLSQRRLKVSSRPQPIALHQPVVEALQRYLAQRDEILCGSACVYFFVTRITYRYNRPVEQAHMHRLLSPARVNLRDLRATCIVETALTGDIKALEQLGLTIDGASPYLHLVKDSLAAKRLGPRES